MKRRIMAMPRLWPPIVLGAVLLAGAFVNGDYAGTRRAARPFVVSTAMVEAADLPRFALPPLTPAMIASAQVNGLPRIDLPSFGSGLTWIGGDEFLGITDRGPNAERAGAAGLPAGTLFPLPSFSPTIIRFRLREGKVVPTEFVPLHDSHGRGVTGLPNDDADDPAFAGPLAAAPLAWEPNGLDIEGIRRFRDGRFLLVDEYGPSIIVASAQGEVLVRYMPTTKRLIGATYPVKNILPAVLQNRRKNKGFESVALSEDGRTAYVILESPLGSAVDSRYAGAGILRSLKLDVSDPLNAKVVGEYLIPLGSVEEYPGTRLQGDIKVSDAEWIAPDVLLMLEHAKGIVKLVLVDQRNATNILYGQEAGTLALEDVRTSVNALSIRAAARSVVFDSRDVSAIDQDKVEGLVVRDPTTVVLATDNDFGIGDNTTGAPCKVWTVRLSAPLPTPSNR